MFVYTNNLLKKNHLRLFPDMFLMSFERHLSLILAFNHIRIDFIFVEYPVWKKINDNEKFSFVYKQGILDDLYIFQGIGILLRYLMDIRF